MSGAAPCLTSKTADDVIFSFNSAQTAGESVKNLHSLINLVHRKPLQVASEHSPVQSVSILVFYMSDNL